MRIFAKIYAWGFFKEPILKLGENGANLFFVFMLQQYFVILITQFLHSTIRTETEWKSKSININVSIWMKINLTSTWPLFEQPKACPVWSTDKSPCVSLRFVHDKRWWLCSLLLSLFFLLGNLISNYRWWFNKKAHYKQGPLQRPKVTRSIAFYWGANLD